MAPRHSSTPSSPPRSVSVADPNLAPVGARYVSQLTALQVFGIDPRRWLERVVPAAGPRVVKVGKLRLLDVDTATRVLADLQQQADESAPEGDDDAPRSREIPANLDEGLARLGLRRRA